MQALSYRWLRLLPVVSATTGPTVLTQVVGHVHGTVVSTSHYLLTPIQAAHHSIAITGSAALPHSDLAVAMVLEAHLHSDRAAVTESEAHLHSD